MSPYLLVLSLSTSCLGSENCAQTKAFRDISDPDNTRQLQKGRDQDIWDFAMPFTEYHPVGSVLHWLRKIIGAYHWVLLKLCVPCPLMYGSVNIHRENREILGKNCKVLARNRSISVLPSQRQTHTLVRLRIYTRKGAKEVCRMSAAAPANMHPELFICTLCQGDIRQKCMTVNKLNCTQLHLCALLQQGWLFPPLSKSDLNCHYLS